VRLFETEIEKDRPVRRASLAPYVTVPESGWAPTWI